MSSKKKVAFAFLVVGAALGAAAVRTEMVQPTGGETHASATPSPEGQHGPGEAQAQLNAERHRLEARVLAAAQIKPLMAALDNNIDGPTLIDLFQSEDWWKDVRAEFPMARIVVGSEVLATYGAPDPGVSDKAVVIGARKQPVSSAVIVIGGAPYFVLASRVAALNEKAPVLVLAKAVDKAMAAASEAPVAVPVAVVNAPAPARNPMQMGLIAGAIVLILGSTLLLIASRGEATPALAGVPTGPYKTSRKSTLQFGSTAQTQAAPNVQPPVGWAPEPVPQTAPVTAASTVPHPQGGRISQVAPAVVTLPPAPAGPPRHPTAPSGVPIGTDGSAGQAFGRYHLLDWLGEGGMAEVFTAVAHGVEGFSRVFVLKRLRPELARDKEAIAQFVDEARMQSNLVHSNIVPVFDFGRVSEEYFMTQEYIVGRDLVRLIARYYERYQQTLVPRLAYYVAHETLQALQYAHTKRDREGHHLGIVHRDVSAGNIIVSAQGEVKLADFGIVKSNKRVSKTQMGMVKGNANFMSPEQARGLVVDARSDLFSIALVLYYCLTNRLFYDGDNDLDVLFKAASGPTTENYEAIRRLPAPACDVLGRALAPDPADRFQTAAEFADVLAPHIGGAKAEAARLMQTLFGEEFRREAA